MQETVRIEEIQEREYNKQAMGGLKRGIRRICLYTIAELTSIPT